MKKKHRKLPPLELLHELFDYDPATGGLYKKHSEPCEANAIGSWNQSGHRMVHVRGHGQYLLHRIVFFMFYRKDPGEYQIDHKNGDRADNRIQNLRRVKPAVNARNLRKKGKYIIGEDGVGRFVSGVAHSHAL